MTSDEGRRLVMLIDGERAGEVVQGEAGQLTLFYDDDWRARLRATPASLSMPLAVREHGDAVTRAFLWGLLPD
nr:HipA N-terminal domain-containing protein [Micromonospora sp. DSM 115978]